MNYDHWKTTNPQDEELGNKEQSSRMKTHLTQTEKELLYALELFVERLNTHGNWDDGCFYYNGRTASELEHPISNAVDVIARAERKIDGRK